MHATYVPSVSQAFSLSLPQKERKRDSNLVPRTSPFAPGLGRERGWRDSETRLMTTVSRHEAAENEQMSVRQEIYVINYGDH